MNTRHFCHVYQAMPVVSYSMPLLFCMWRKRDDQANVLINLFVFFLVFGNWALLSPLFIAFCCACHLSRIIFTCQIFT